MDHLLYPSTLTPELIEGLLYSILSHLGPQQIDWDENVLSEFPLMWGSSQSKQFQPSSAEPYLDFLSAREIALLISTPRQLKHLLRRLGKSLNFLTGEISLIDLFLVIILRVCLSDVFNFLMKYNDLLRTSLTDDNTGNDTISMRHMKQEWEEVSATIGPEKTGIAQKILVFLYGDLEKKLKISLKSQQKEYLYGRQRIRFSSPTDYWKRAVEENIDGNELSDMTVNALHQEWLKKERDRLIHKLIEPIFASKWFHIKLHTLSELQVISIIEAYVIHHGSSDTGPADLYLPSDPTLPRLLQHFHQRPPNDDIILKRILSLIERLMDTNLLLAYQISERLIQTKMFAAPFANDVIVVIKNALNRYSSAHDFFSIIPAGNKYNDLLKYLFALVYPEAKLPPNIRALLDESLEITHTFHVLGVESLIRFTGTWNTSYFETNNNQYFHGMDFLKLEKALDKTIAKRFAKLLQKFTPSDPILIRDLDQIKAYAIEYSKSHPDQSTSTSSIYKPNS